jgi:outer membrane immunogenic protein
MRGLAAGVALAALALASPASAAGMYWAPPGALWSWTGFYVGLNAGGGWTFDNGAPRCIDPNGVNNGPGCQIVPDNTTNGSGFIGGGQIGYNWQINPAWVLGLETDFQGSNLGGSATVSGRFALFGGGLAANPATFTANDKLDWFGTVRGRVGLAIGRSLFYTTAGLAYGEAALNTNFATPFFTFPANATATKVGWIGGIGAEGVLVGNWSAKVEALYYDLGKTTLLGAGIPATSGFVRGKDFETEGVIVRGGLNLKLGL